MPHIHEKIDFCSEVLVVNKGAVLLRMHEKYNLWLPPGGHIELPEDPVEAALREVKEEVGLEVTLVGEESPDFGPKDRPLLAPRFVNRHRINDSHEHVVFIYVGTSETRDITPGEGEADCETKWFTREELDDPKYGVTERVKHYAKAALDALTK